MQNIRDSDRGRSEVDSREGSVDSEEVLERRKLERQLKEKESSYQKRLRNWEAREERKERDQRDFIRKERETKEAETREAKKLKIFLEDYDDDRDDVKYYRGSSFKERLRDRQRELEEDERDRRNELRELQELREKLEKEGHPDPDSEAEKRMNPVSSSVQDESPPPSASNGTVVKRTMDDRIKELVGDARSKSDEERETTRRSTEIKEEIRLNPFTLQQKKTSNTNRDSSQSPNNEKKRRHVPDIFAAQEEEDNESAVKRRRLPNLHDDEDSQSRSNSVSSEEKKKQIKQLIEQIPTTRQELFAVDIDWSFVDNTLMDKRIRPWINKKITEFIGEEEPALVDFICKKLGTKCSAEGILSDVIEILDEEAETFVIKLWRLLIYESKIKQQGLAKL